MKYILQKLIFLFTCFSSSASFATPKVFISNYTFSFPKTENVKQATEVKIGIHQNARSSISGNQPQTTTFHQKTYPLSSYLKEEKSCDLDFQKTGAPYQIKVAQFSKKEQLSLLENRAREELSKGVNTADDVAAEVINSVGNVMNNTTFRNAWNAIYTTVQIVDGIVAAPAIITSLPQFYKLVKESKYVLATKRFVKNNFFEFVRGKSVSQAGDFLPNLLNKVDNVENAVVSVAKNEAEIIDELGLVNSGNPVTENAKKFWAQHEMNVTSYLETTYGSTKVGQQITVDVYIQGSSTPVRCRIDNLIDVGGGKFRIADGKSSIVNNLSNKTPTELLSSMSTANQKIFYEALKNGTVTQIKPAGNRALTFLGNLNPIQVEKSIDFFVNDVSTNGYNIFKKTLLQ